MLDDENHVLMEDYVDGGLKRLTNMLYMSKYIHTYIHTPTQPPTHPSIHKYIHTYIQTHTYIHTYIYTYKHTYIHTYKHTYIHTYMFVVNFDALAQASDIWIERRQVVFLCWRQDSNPSGSQTPSRQQTECPPTNRLSYRGSSLKLELDRPSLWSASIQPTRPHSRLAFAPGSGDLHVCCC